MTTTQLTWEQIEELIPKHVELYYVDYNDNLDEQYEVLQKCITKQSIDYLYEKVDDWYTDDYDSMNNIIDEVKNDIENKYDIENASEIIGENIDRIKEVIYERDNSNVIKDLVRNTSEMLMFYDTGYEMGSESWSWTDKQIKQERQYIKKYLGIPAKENKWDKDLDMMIRQASYGGNLEIYFKDNPVDYVFEDNIYNKINFVNPTIGIINHSNGSGDQCELVGLSITLPFNPKNTFIEKAVSYNWSYDIAGMCHDAYDSCTVSFLKGKTKKELPLSDNIAHMEKEAKLDEIFKNGSCTPGDMKFGRHRNITYINNFPCGNKCTSCGTFWID